MVVVEPLTSAQGGRVLLALSKLCEANTICLTLVGALHAPGRLRVPMHAGSSSPTKSPMIAITTSNSTSVKAFTQFDSAHGQTFPNSNN